MSSLPPNYQYQNTAKNQGRNSNQPALSSNVFKGC